MNLKLDHIVQYVNNLDHAEKVFQDHGLTAKFGGNHMQDGTHNSLSYFGLTYLEFLAIFDKNKVEKSKQLISHDSLHYLPQQEIFSRVALRTTDIKQVEKHLEKFKLNLSPIFDGARKTPEGDEIQWKLLTIKGSYEKLPYPFIISWEMSDRQRLLFLTEKKLLDQHKMKDVTLQEVIFLVNQPEKIVNYWQKLFFLEKLNQQQLIVGDQIFTFVKSTKETRLDEIIFTGTFPQNFKFLVGGAKFKMIGK